MQYIISRWGNGISVGLIGNPEEIETNAALAHNLFKAPFFEDRFNGRLNFSSCHKFYKFLLYKHSFPIMMKSNCLMRQAMKMNRKNMKDEIRFDNFMTKVQKSGPRYSIGTHNDGDFNNQFED